MSEFNLNDVFPLSTAQGFETPPSPWPQGYWGVPGLALDSEAVSFTATGALEQGSASISSNVIQTFIGTGSLVQSAASVAGVGVLTFVGIGGLTQAAASFNADGVLEFIATGSPVQGTASISGEGLLSFAVTSALVAPSSTIEAIAGQTFIVTSTLTQGAASIAGEGGMTIAVTGAVESSPLEVSGEALQVFAANGALTGEQSQVDGVGFVEEEGTFTVSGILLQNAASVAGEGTVGEAPPPAPAPTPTPRVSRGAGGGRPSSGKWKIPVVEMPDEDPPILSIGVAGGLIQRPGTVQGFVTVTNPILPPIKPLLFNTPGPVTGTASLRPRPSKVKARAFVQQPLSRPPRRQKAIPTPAAEILSTPIPVKRKRTVVAAPAFDGDAEFEEAAVTLILMEL